MSCPSQERLSIYVDGELALGELRALESHLMQCRRCRATVLALRDEVAVLCDVLQGRDLAPLHAVEPGEQARGLVIGIVPTLGIAALVVTVVGWLLETSLPAGTAWLSPIQLMGAYDMIFNTIFVLRDRAPGLVELAVATGALFGVASVLTFLAGSLGRRLTGPGLVVLAALAAAATLPGGAEAFDLRLDEERVVIAAGETLSETLIVSAESIRVDGRIEGDLLALAENIRIEGEVEGNVVAVGEHVELLGVVDGSLHVAGKVVRIEGEVDDDLYAFSEDFTLYEEGRVERDVAIFGERVRLDGRVGRDVLFGGDRVELRGEVGRNLVVRGEQAALHDGTRLAGDFDVRLPEGEQAEVAPGAVIGGERIEGVLVHDHGGWRDRWSDAGFYLAQLAHLVAAFLVGMLLYLVRPGIFESSLPTAGEFFRELGLGFVTLVIAPIAIVICFVTVVGIPLGLIALFVFVTGLFVSLIVVAALIGRALLGGRAESVHAFGRALLLGLLIVVVAVNLPGIGGLVWIVALTTGVGMLVTHFRDVHRVWRAP